MKSNNNKVEPIELSSDELENVSGGNRELTQFKQKCPYLEIGRNNYKGPDVDEVCSFCKHLTVEAGKYICNASIIEMVIIP